MQGWNSVSVFHHRKQPMPPEANNAPENATLFQRTHSAYEFKSESTAKVVIKNKRLKAGWDNEYLLKVLFSMNKK